jgi:subtilisin family serine protease
VTARSAGRVAATGVLLTAVSIAVSMAPSGAASAAPGDHGVRGGGFYKTTGPEYVKDSYIVVFKDAKVSKDQVGATAGRLGARYGRVGHTYSSTLRGFSAEMSADRAKQIAAEPEVARVEQVVKYRMTDTQSNPPWGLDRIDEQALPVNSGYTYPSTASSVHAYVIDTGIRASHSEFQGRVTSGPDYVEDDNNADDCNGHGTHVAGTIGGLASGVAKGVNLHSVRVLDCDGYGNSADVAAAVDWVTANAIKPAVVNMSLGGSTLDPGSSAVSTAVAASIAAGITYTVAAGNDADNACFYSPAVVGQAITVGATDDIDYIASFSNVGGCVDIFAPGVDILSANISGGLTRKSGTSMASPHVAGAAALLLAANPTWTPAQVADKLNADSASTVHHALGDTPKRLLQLTDALDDQASLSLIARVNAKLVSAANGGGTLIANSNAPGATEKFERVSTGGETFALRVGNSFVRLNGAAQLEASATDLAGAERFRFEQQSDLGFGLRASNGRFVAAEGAGAGALVADRTSVGAWETFEKQSPELVVNLKAFANGKFVTAENAGGAALIANRPSPGLWEGFDIVETADGYVGLRSHANGKYVTAENGGSSPLIARGTSIGPWEKFWFLHLGNGEFALWSYSNGLLVSAEGAGNQPLISRTAPEDLGDWEVFTRSVTIF